MKDVKVIIGANYGDEGKGLLTRYFAKQNPNSIVVFHNGTAQRGHTVDYNPHYRHVFHHFGSGSGDKVPTFFTDTFWVHPMEFAREYKQLAVEGIVPMTICDPNALVVTPFDMLIDHATEAWIHLINGEPEYGSCGYGTWCATDRYPRATFRVTDFMAKDPLFFNYMMEEVWKECLAILISRGVDVDRLPQFKNYFILNSSQKANLISHFKDDLAFFFNKTNILSFDKVYDTYDSLIFENGQGLGLDRNVDNDWHTTSNTGLINPYNMLKDKTDFNAEVCYVSRSYLTRHGVGPLEEAVKKSEINESMVDRTNVHNNFQGSLRYGYLADKDQRERITKDWAIAEADNRFKKSMAITHCNEFADLYQQAEYFSNNPYNVIKR